MNQDVYQLYEGFKRVGFTRETTKNVDPLAGGSGDRLNFPGPIINAPTLSEDYGFRALTPFGDGPDVSFFARERKAHEFEFEGLLTDVFAGADDLISHVLGTIDAGTGSVTPRQGIPQRTVTVEHAYINPQQQQISFSFEDAGGGNVVDGTYTLTFTDAAGTTIATFVASTSSFAVALGDLEGDIDSGTALLSATVVSNVLTVEATTVAGNDVANAGNPFSFEVTASPTETSVIVSAETNTSWINRWTGCKLNTIQLTAAADALVQIRYSFLAQHYDRLQIPVQTSGVQVDELVKHSGPPVDNTNITYTLQRLDGATIPSRLRDMDLMITNNMTREYTDNQSLDPTSIIEGRRTVTWNLTRTKIDNILWQIAQSDPSLNVGKLFFRMLINQTAGFYFDLTQAEAVLTDPAMTVNADTDAVEETYAAAGVGAPALDMSSA